MKLNPHTIIALTLSACLTTGVATATNFDTSGKITGQQTVAVKTDGFGSDVIKVPTMAAGADALMSCLSSLPAGSKVTVENGEQFAHMVRTAEQNGSDISVIKTLHIVALDVKVINAGYKSTDDFASLVGIPLPQAPDERSNYVAKVNSTFDAMAAAGTLPEIIVASADTTGASDKEQA